MGFWRAVFLTVVLLVSGTSTTITVLAQDSNTVRLTGSIGMSYDVYSIESSGATSTLGRRPASVVRFTADPIISVGDWLSLPIIISCTFREAAVIQPSFNYPDVMSFLQNPMNRFSISPRLGWATFHLGSIVPKHGALTVGNAQLFGLGVDLEPGMFRASATYGTLFRAVPADTITGRSGSYARTLWTFRIGSETADQSAVGLTVAYMNDDQSSIPFITQETTIPIPIVDSTGVVVRDSLLSFTQRSSLLSQPQEGAAFGIDFKSQFGDGFHTAGEIAVTAFTRDKSASELADPLPVVSAFMTTRSSTRVDAAAKFEAGYRSPDWGVTAGALYAGPGFVVLSQPFFQPDRIDVNVSPSIRVFDGKLFASATVGYRITDLSNMLTAGSTQLLLGLNATGTIIEGFTVSGSYTNFGYRTTRAADTLRYEQVSNSISVMPSYTLLSGDLRHIMSVSLSNDAFSDMTQQNVPSSANTTTAYMLMYGISPVTSTWSGRATLSLVGNNLVTTKTTMKSGSLSGSFRALEGRLEPDIAVTYSLNEIGGLPPETQMTVRGGCRARIIPSLNVFATVQWNNVNSSDTVNGRAYKEMLGTFGVRWSF